MTSGKLPYMGTTPDILVAVIKLPVEEAIVKIKEAGLRARIRSEDGVGRVGTADFRMDRVNLEIESGIVTNAFMG